MLKNLIFKNQFIFLGLQKLARINSTNNDIRTNETEQEDLTKTKIKKNVRIFQASNDHYLYDNEDVYDNEKQIQNLPTKRKANINESIPTKQYSKFILGFIFKLKLLF